MSLPEPFLIMFDNVGHQMHNHAANSHTIMYNFEDFILRAYRLNMFGSARIGDYIEAIVPIQELFRFAEVFFD